MFLCHNFTADKCWLLNASVSMSNSSFLQLYKSVALSKPKETLTMKDKNHVTSSNYTEIQVKQGLCTKPATCLFSTLQLFPNMSESRFTVHCMYQLLATTLSQALKHVHMRGNISSWIRQNKVYKDLNLKQYFIKLEIKITFKT